MKREVLVASFVLVLTLAFICALPAAGQVATGSISGVLQGPDKVAVSGAEIKASSEQNGFIFSATSNHQGVFQLSFLPAGTYSIKITAQPFTVVDEREVQVGAGRNVSLGVISLSSQESAPIRPPRVDAAQSQVTTTFTGTELHSFAGQQENEGLGQLAPFVPGITAGRKNTFSNANGAGLSANGQRSRNNDQQIDGQGNNDSNVGGPSLWLADTNFAQEFAVVTSGFGPEYGRNSGAVVNLITSSGTDRWHGSVYGAENNSYLNALSNYQKNFAAGFGPTGIGPLSGPPRSNQVFGGFTLGGPVFKDKLFLFSGLDAQIFSGNTIYNSPDLTPTPAGLAQLFGCFPVSQGLFLFSKFGPYALNQGNPIPVNNQTFGQSTLLNVGTCNNVPFSGVQRIVSTPARQFNWIEKADWHVGGDIVSARYLFNRNNRFNINDNASGDFLYDTTDLSQAVLMSWTHNFSSRMTNELRGGYSRMNAAFGGSDVGSPFLPDPARLDQGLASVSFLTPGFIGIGPSSTLPQSRVLGTWQTQDNWNYLLGKHQLKAGVNWSYQRSLNIYLPNINGQYRFDDLLALINNTPSQVVIADGDPRVDIREHDTFLYGGDDWKITRNLTLNLGITWSHFGLPDFLNSVTTKRENDATTAFWATTSSFTNQPIPLSVRTNPAIPSVSDTFGPSIGFAYSPQWGGFLSGGNKLVIRGGYRRLYDPPFFNIYENVASSAPFSFLQPLTGAQVKPIPIVPTGPNVRFSFATALTPGIFDPRELAQTSLASNFRPSTVDSWNFGIERQIGNNSVVEARYVGNHAHNLFESVNANPFIADLQTDFPTLVPAGLTPCPVASAAAAAAVGRVDCNEGVLHTITNGAFSNYHALQFEFRTSNLFKQLTLRTGYTYSKTLDNSSEIYSIPPGTGVAPLNNSLLIAQNPFRGLPYTVSSLNVPHAWTIDAVEQLPFFKEQHGLAGHLFGGWGIAVSYVYASGQPYTPIQASDALRTSVGNYYDSAFMTAFGNNIDAALPFVGNLSAPASSVGIFAGDACQLRPGLACGLPQNQLLNYNLLNQTNVPQILTKNDVRYIVNAGLSEQIFGTPYGDAGRNSLIGPVQNIANISITKRLKLGERSSFEFRGTALNAFNHFNYPGVDPMIDHAGRLGEGVGFANPASTNASGRTLLIGGTLTF